MKRLKHYLLLAALSFTAMCCGTEDGNASEGNNTDNGGETVTGETTLALTRTGTQGIIIRDPNNDFTEEIEVTRTGTDATASFRVSVWTEGELTAYNEERGTAYYLLPSNAYTLTETGSVAQGQTSATVPVTLRVDELKALVGEAENAGRQYVLPLRLTSENATVQSIRSEVMLLVSLNIPYFRLLDAGTSRTVFLEEEETAVRVGSRLMTGSSLVGTETGFGYTLAAPSNAETLVEEYNRIHGTGYELLPESAYTSQETRYGEGESTSTAVVTIHREQTGDGIYMLPLSVDLEEGANVQNGGDVCYILTGKHSYTNPIIRQSVPDPTVLRDTDGYYYLYGTEDLGWIPVFRSIDMVDWERMPKDCFQTQDSRPYWGDDDATSSRSLWAPEIRYINGQYVLYYSWAIWGNEWNSDVGVAVSDSPTGPFTDRGQVIDAEDTGVQNSIDQFEYEENGQRYLFWGSFHGIYVTELNDDGLSAKRNDDGSLTMLQRVAGNAYEGSCIYKRGDWYYLFASIGSCCDGLNSTYQTVVGRSSSLFGPYVNKDGGTMLDNQHEILITAGDEFIATGHNSIIQHDDAGQTWIIFHGYVRSDVDNGRNVFLERILWDEDGWPYVEGGTPSTKALAPVIRR